MQTSLIYGFIAAMITWFFMFLDSRLLDNPKTKSTYLKNMLFVGCLVAFGIYFIGEDKFSFNLPSLNEQPTRRGGRQSYLGSLHEDILTGTPNF